MLNVVASGSVVLVLKALIVSSPTAGAELVMSQRPLQT
jgi:hypothetical protein